MKARRETKLKDSFSFKDTMIVDSVSVSSCSTIKDEYGTLASVHMSSPMNELTINIPASEAMSMFNKRLVVEVHMK